MKEIELLREVCAIAARYHLLVFHCHDSRSGLGRGFPDLVIAGPKRTGFFELKGTGGTLTPDQRHWGSVLEKSGELWTVWRPADLQSRVIQSTLESFASHEQLAL